MIVDIKEEYKQAIENRLRDIFIKTMYNCFQENIPYEEIPKRCLDATLGTKDLFLRNRVKMYEEMGGTIDDIFPITIEPPEYATFKRLMKLIHYERMELIFEKYLHWLWLE